MPPSHARRAPAEPGCWEASRLWAARTRSHAGVRCSRRVEPLPATLQVNSPATRTRPLQSLKSDGQRRA
ncbi:hypothetical protein AAFF_G00282020 [Aldrovandia affinis]|uniref:Uncharacterized protein n=1 Tax=Aldrovandia affinis TaxID=143900 RepID=A0AAD7RAE2_9TELE|nr:hypothetical protein AAFF_G00282020 [Aldrovandia affinis]